MRYVILLLSCASSLWTMGQNLVPNGSFEEYTECPTNMGQVERAVGWISNGASPDYYNRCNTNDSVDVPLNQIGYQNAFDGDGYMGAYTYLEDAPTYRECFQHSLSAPMLPGIPVYLSMMVSPGGFGNDPNNNSIRYASNGIGMKFSVQPHSNYLYWPGNVALSFASVLNDTASWVQVSGEYVPDSAYGYVTIGSFLPYDDISVQILDPNGQAYGAYVFVDQICVSTNATDCALSIGIHEISPPLLNIGQNPVGSELRLHFDGSVVLGASIVLMDGTGRAIQRKQIADGATDICWFLDGMANGSYYVQLQTPSGQFRPIHIVHINP